MTDLSAVGAIVLVVSSVLWIFLPVIAILGGERENTRAIEFAEPVVMRTGHGAFGMG